jgi:hypothetical protein
MGIYALYNEEHTSKKNRLTAHTDGVGFFALRWLNTCTISIK